MVSATTPVSAHAHSERARALIQQRRFDLAEQEARRAIQQDPTWAEAYHLLGIAFWGQGNLTDARAALEEALRLKPDDAYVHSTLATVLTRLGGRHNRRAAKQHFAHSLASKPDEAIFYDRYARFHWPGNPKAAKRANEQALRLNPRLVDALLFRAAMLLPKRRYAEAESAIRQALAVEPNDGTAHAMLTDVQLLRYHPNDALASAREALRLDPNNPALRRNLVLALQAKIPLLGRFWAVNTYNPRAARITWLLMALCGVCVCCPTVVKLTTTDSLLTVGCLGSLFLLWGLFLWIIDPLMTYLVLNGKIK